MDKKRYFWIKSIKNFYMFKTSLEQWLLLKAVVDAGSIARAAELHHRSQPAVSYQLNQLQERLGIELLRLEGRRLELTDEGQALLLRASQLLEGWQDLEFRAAALRAGERLSVSLVIDSRFPRQRLLRALKQFSAEHPRTQVHIREIIRAEGVEEIGQNSGDLYLVTLPEDSTIEREFMVDLTFALVVQRDHPLCSTAVNPSSAQLTEYPKIQVVDKSTQQRSASANQESWYFTSCEAAIDAVVAGLGYGWLPLSDIESLLASGELRYLTHPPQTRTTPLYFVRSPETRYDVVVGALAEALLSG